MIRRIATIVLVAIAATAFAACEGEVSASVGKKLDTDKLEKKLAEELPNDDTPVNVDCPDDVKMKEGDEFDCTFEQDVEDGDEGVVTITQTDDDGGVDYKVTEINGQTEEEAAAAAEEEAGAMDDGSTEEMSGEEEVVEGE